jgi:hypothetical protein
MRYRRHERPGDQRTDAAEPHATAGAPPTERLLALQRSAGNRAVSAMLARAPDTAVPADAKGTEGSGMRATLEGIGTIPLLSINIQPGRGMRDEQSLPREITVTSRYGPHSARLHKAMLDGKAMDVEIVMQGRGATVRLSLKAAVVSGYHPPGGDEIESWTLDYSSITHSVEGEESDRGRRDERPPG